MHWIKDKIRAIANNKLCGGCPVPRHRHFEKSWSPQSSGETFGL